MSSGRQARASAFTALAVAIVKGFVRDKASVFFAVVFPLMFLVLFGGIFDVDESPRIELVQVGEVPLFAQLPDGAREAFEETFEVTRAADLDAALEQVRTGDADAAVRMDGDTLVAHYTQTDQVKAAVTQGTLRAFVDGANVDLKFSGDLYSEGEISYEAALAHADSPNDLRLMIKLGSDADPDPMAAVGSLQIEQDEPSTPTVNACIAPTVISCAAPTVIDSLMPTLCVRCMATEAVSFAPTAMVRTRLVMSVARGHGPRGRRAPKVAPCRPSCHAARPSGSARRPSRRMPRQRVRRRSRRPP